MTRLLRAAVLLPVVLFTVAALPSSVLRCRYRGLQVSACCCPKGDAAEAAAEATIREADCCDREVVSVVRPPVERQPSSATLGLVAFESARTLLDADHFPGASVAGPWRTSDAHVPGPPLLLVKRAWLI